MHTATLIHFMQLLQGLLANR